MRHPVCYQQNIKKILELGMLQNCEHHLFKHSRPCEKPHLMWVIELECDRTSKSLHCQTKISSDYQYHTSTSIKETNLHSSTCTGQPYADRGGNKIGCKLSPNVEEIQLKISHIPPWTLAPITDGSKIESEY